MAPSSKTPPRQSNIAVLIDGANSQPALFEKIMLEVSRYGRPTIRRRIYGDWTSPNINSWKECLHDHAVAPVLQFRNTIGNATDSAMNVYK